MSWKIRECYEFDAENRYENLDDLFSDIRDNVDSEEFDDDFEEYLNDNYGSLEVFGECFDAAEVLRECGSYGQYEDARNSWFEDCLDLAYRDCQWNEAHSGSGFTTTDLFGWVIEFVEDEPDSEKVARIFCKDETINSVYLWAVYVNKDVELVDGIVNALNERAISEQKTVRYFVAEPNYHPTRAEIHAGL